MELKDKLTTARRNAGMTQKMAAEAMGVAQNTVCNWELGKTKPKKMHLLALAQIYGVSTEIFLP